jgi:hypothetical protein
MLPLTPAPGFCSRNPFPVPILPFLIPPTWQKLPSFVFKAGSPAWVRFVFSVALPLWDHFGDSPLSSEGP